MYLLPEKTKPQHTAQHLAAAHPSIRRTMTEHQTQPVVHVDFNTFISPSNGYANNAQRHTQQYPAHSQSQLALSDDGDQRSSDQNDLGTQRFVAGEQFYNYEMYGSLRKGSVVTFFSWYCLGLAAATFSSALSYSCLQSTARPYLAIRLNLESQEITAVQRLIELPMALSFFIGLLTDGYPIMGLRRKGYMVLGLVLNAVSILALGCISMYIESLHDSKARGGWVVYLSLLLIALASFGCIITYVCVHTRTIELSQREPLRKRGSIVAEYLIFRRLVAFVGAGYAIFTLGPSGSVSSKGEPRLEFSTAMFILAFVCAAPLPIILRYWKEEHYNLSTSLRVRGQIFWKIMQQKAVWRVLMFIVIFAFFLTIRISDANTVIRIWSGSNNDNYQLTRSIADMIAILTFVVWRTCNLNTLWPRFYCWGPILQVIPNVLANVLVAQDVNRNRYVFRSITSVANIADAILTLNPVVPLIEIIQEGSEGATVGLTFTLERVTKIFVNTNAQGLFRGENFYNIKAASKDLVSEHDSVMWASLLGYGINLLALLGLFFLPSQKLDAQQLRMYGGFTKAASAMIATFISILFLYSTAINIMSFIPGVSCYQLVGGKGC